MGELILVCFCDNHFIVLLVLTDFDGEEVGWKQMEN